MEEVGLPGVEEYAGWKCDKTPGRFAGNVSFSEGLIEGQGQNGHFHSVKTL
jgi:hypothetical protein